MKNANEGSLLPERFAAGRTLLRAWNRFWFTPSDPTLLGLVRLCCGAITLYTLVAYSFTLQDLFGKDAWVNSALIDDIRHNRPLGGPASVSAPLGWDPAPPNYAPEPQGAFQEAYQEFYVNKWGVNPPAPYPRNEAEKKAIDDFCVRWQVDPRVLTVKGDFSWSLWYHVSDPVTMAVLHGAICLIVFLFTIGLATRITSVLTWAAALTYIHRAPTTLFGVDTMMTILLLYLMIGPSGAALSADRWVARWWARNRPRVLARWRAFWHREGDAAMPPPTMLGPPEPSVAANFAIRLLQIHVCIIYLVAGLSKLQGPAWWNGTAVWGTLANFEFAPMQYELYMDFLRRLAGNRLVWEIFMTSAGLFTLFFEITYIFLIWRPATRWLILSMAMVLHGFIGVFMGLKTFSLMMLVMNMAFLRPNEVAFLLRPFRRRKANAPAWSEPALALQAAGSEAFVPAAAGKRVLRKQ